MDPTHVTCRSRLVSTEAPAARRTVQCLRRDCVGGILAGLQQHDPPTSTIPLQLPECSCESGRKARIGCVLRGSC
jgi:hypothetical protein